MLFFFRQVKKIVSNTTIVVPFQNIESTASVSDVNYNFTNNIFALKTLTRQKRLSSTKIQSLLPETFFSALFSFLFVSKWDNCTECEPVSKAIKRESSQACNILRNNKRFSRGVNGIPSRKDDHVIF